MSSLNQSRPTDAILEGLNRLYEAKLTGVLAPDELSKIISNIGDLFANKIAQGKVTPEEIESAESYVTCFIGDNKSNYFDFNHTDLDIASRGFLEGSSVAQAKVDKRMLSAQPVSNGHSLGLRRFI